MLAVCCVPTGQTLTLTTYMNVRTVHIKNIPDDKQLHRLPLPTPVQILMFRWNLCWLLHTFPNVVARQVEHLPHL